MKIICILAVACVLAGVSRADGADRILPYPIHTHRLANGLNVVTVPFDSPGLAAFYVVVRAGSRNEVEKGVTGFAHFFEHMMFRGSATRAKSSGPTGSAPRNLGRAHG